MLLKYKFSIASTLLSLIALICVTIVNYNIWDDYNDADGKARAFFDIIILNKYHSNIIYWYFHLFHCF